MPFAVVGPAIPIFMAGDSHTLAYSDLIFENDATRYVTRAKYCNGITAQKFTDPQGNLYPTLLTALESELLVSRSGGNLVANHRILTGNTVAEGLARERAQVTPILCIFAGDVDMRTVFLANFKSLDFELPGDASTDIADEADVTETVPYNVVRAYCKRLLEPLFAGLRTLASIGFKNLYLHSLPPPTTDDALFEAQHLFRTNVGLRYKAAHLFNTLLSEFAREDGRVRYVDMWSSTRIDGRLNPAFALDGTHLNRRAAALTVEHILSDVVQRRNLFDGERYRIAAKTARAHRNGSPCSRPDVQEGFASEGLLRIDIGSERAASLRSLVETGLYRAEAPTGWAFDPLEPNLSYEARPTIELLRELGKVLYETDLSEILAACFTYDVTVLNVRAFQSIGFLDMRFDGPKRTQFGPLIFPPDVFRGVLYLDDVSHTSQGPLAIREEDRVRFIPGAAGTLLIFDPHRIAIDPHETVPTKVNNLDILFGPRVPGAHARLIAAPGNALWPLDPLNVIVGDSLVVDCQAGAPTS